MPFALAGAAATVGVGLYSANKQSDSIKAGQDAANAQAEKAQAAAGQAFAPYQAAGSNALSSYGNLLGLNGQDAANQAMSQFKASPGFQYQLTQGLQSVDHGAAAQGMLRSGETLRAEQVLGDQLASQDFGNYLNRLNGMANIGLQASGGLVNAYTGQANNIQSTDTGAAGANAGIYGSEGKAITSGINSATNSLAQMYQSGSGLFGPSSGGNLGADGFRTGAGGTNAAGANALQSMGFYTPIAT